METDRSDFISDLDFIPPWKIPILFGALKFYKRAFWTAEEIKHINETYRTDLCNYNGFPIYYFDLFQRKPTAEEFGSSFVVDIRSDGEYLKYIILDINYNLEQLYKITHMVKKWAMSKEKSTSELYDEIKAYMEAEKPNLDWPYDDKYYYPFWNTIVVKNPNRAERLIWEDAHNYKEIWEEKEDGSYDIVDVEIKNTKLRIKDVDHIKLNKKALSIVKNNLQGLDKADLETCINLIENFKYYVLEKNYRKFLRECSKYQGFLNAVLDIVVIWTATNIIRKYYSYSTALEINKKEIEEEKQLVINQFADMFWLSNDNFNCEFLCSFIDVMAYFYKKGFQLFSRDGFLDANELMRYFIPISSSTWNCFDPIKHLEWVDYLKDAKIMNEDKKNQLWRVLGYVIENNIIFSSSLIIDAFEITCNASCYDDAIKRVDKAISEYRSKMRKGIIHF